MIIQEILIKLHVSPAEMIYKNIEHTEVATSDFPFNITQYQFSLPVKRNWVKWKRNDRVGELQG